MTSAPPRLPPDVRALVVRQVAAALAAAWRRQHEPVEEPADDARGVAVGAHRAYHTPARPLEDTRS